MSLSKLGVMLLADYWKQFDTIRAHLSQSAVELIKAMEETLSVVEKGNGQLSIHPLQETLVNKALGPLSLLLQHSGNKLRKQRLAPESVPTADPLRLSQGNDIKRRLIHSLVEALDAEMARVACCGDTAQASLTRDALETVRKVLLSQVPETLADDKNDSAAPHPEEEEVVITFKNDSELTTLQLEQDHVCEEEIPLAIDEFQQIRTA